MEKDEKKLSKILSPEKDGKSSEPKYKERKRKLSKNDDEIEYLPGKEDSLQNSPQKKMKKETSPNESLNSPLTMGPKKSLHPLLSSSKNFDKYMVRQMTSNVEQGKKLAVSLDKNEVTKYLKATNLKVLASLKSDPDMKNDGQKTSTDMEASSTVNDTVPDDEETDDTEYKNFINSKGNVRCAYYWGDGELRDFAYALQAHGFSDYTKLADIIKTRTVNHVDNFVKRNHVVQKDKKTLKFSVDPALGTRPQLRWFTGSHEHLAEWPNVRKFRRLAYEQMLLYTRSKDYSKPVMVALCKKFHDEEPDPVDSQVINVKLIYKYMMDCMAGKVPPQLPPKESALVLDMFREVRLMPIAYDMEEERKFIQGYKSSTIFRPFQLKDEFRKKYKKPLDDEEYGPNTVSVPDEVFLDLSRHKRLIQSFNPLVTPIWFLQKEQEFLQKYTEESNVYVD